jgi:hypothetical protein
VDNYENRYYIKLKGERVWREYKNNRVFAEFTLVNYDSDWNPILYDSKRKFYIKITNDSVHWDEKPLNFKYEFGYGKWAVAPPISSII